MEALRRTIRGRVAAGTRQYGPATSLPVAEDAPTDPRGVHEVSNLAAEKIIQVFHRTHGIPAVLLRLSNVYGPRAQMRHPHYGVVNWFVRLALDGAVIPVFGDGSIQRDFLYVDDCIDALLMCGATPAAFGEVLNVGVDQPNTFLQVAELLTRICPGYWQFAPFSPERKARSRAISIRMSARLLACGLAAEHGSRRRLRRTVEYYRGCSQQYWPRASKAA